MSGSTNLGLRLPGKNKLLIGAINFDFSIK